MNRRKGGNRPAVTGEWTAGSRSPWPAGLTSVEVAGQLLELAEQVSGLLLPVQPDTDFHRRLKGELLLKAQGQQVERGTNGFQQHRKGILIGAVIGSLASVIGVIIACIVRYRHGRASHIMAN